jgi:hypothetical protein
LMMALRANKAIIQRPWLARDAYQGSQLRRTRARENVGRGKPRRQYTSSGQIAKQTRQMVGLVHIARRASKVCKKATVHPAPSKRIKENNMGIGNTHRRNKSHSRVCLPAGRDRRPICHRRRALRCAGLRVGSCTRGGRSPRQCMPATGLCSVGT